MILDLEKKLDKSGSNDISTKCHNWMKLLIHSCLHDQKHEVKINKKTSTTRTTTTGVPQSVLGPLLPNIIINMDMSELKFSKTV